MTQPVYDLEAKTLRFSIGITSERVDPEGRVVAGARRRVPLLLEMAAPDETAMRDFLNRKVVRLEPKRDDAGDYFDPAEEDEAQDAEFFDRHLVSASLRGGRAVTADELARLDSIYKVKSKTVGGLGFGNVSPVTVGPAEAGVAEGDELELLLGGRSVQLECWLCDEGWVERVVRTTHRFRAPTAKDEAVWRTCTRTQRRFGRRDALEVRVDHHRLAGLWEAMVESVDGYSGGDPLKRVPVLHRVAALRLVFGGVAEKNG